MDLLLGQGEGKGETTDFARRVIHTSIYIDPCLWILAFGDTASITQKETPLLLLVDHNILVRNKMCYKDYSRAHTWWDPPHKAVRLLSL